jgi:hypothetical protein
MCQHSVTQLYLWIICTARMYMNVVYFDGNTTASKCSWLVLIKQHTMKKPYGAVYIQFQDPWFLQKEHTNGSFMSRLLYQIPLYHTCYMPIPLITPVISGDYSNYDTHKLNTSLHPPASSFQLAPDIPLSTLLSNTFSLQFSLEYEIKLSYSSVWAIQNAEICKLTIFVTLLLEL